jgi:hypothetical protein
MLNNYDWGNALIAANGGTQSRINTLQPMALTVNAMQSDPVSFQSANTPRPDQVVPADWYDYIPWGQIAPAIPDAIRKPILDAQIKAGKYLLLAVLGVVIIAIGLWAIIGTERIVATGKAAGKAAAE